MALLSSFAERAPQRPDRVLPAAWLDQRAPDAPVVGLHRPVAPDVDPRMHIRQETLRAGELKPRGDKLDRLELLVLEVYGPAPAIAAKLAGPAF